MGTGIWFTPYLIHNLGIDLYGLVPLTTQFTDYMAVLTVALTTAVGRFLTIDLVHGDCDSANRTFNTAFWTSLLIGGCALPLIGVLVWAAPLILRIPEGAELSVRCLFAATMGSFLLTTVGSSFAVSTFARNRFDVRNYVEVLFLVTRVGFVVILFRCLHPSLVAVAAGVILAATVRQIGYNVAWRKLTPELRVSSSMYDRLRLRSMLSMSGWLTMNQVGWLLYNSIDLVILNAMVGTREAGLYGPILQLATLLRALASVVTSVVTPTIVACHAQGDEEGIVRISILAIRTMGAAIALPVGIVCGLAGPILSIWLGDQWRDVAPVVWVLVGPLTAALAVAPLASVYIAQNKVRTPGIVLILQGFGNLLLALFLTGLLGWGMYGVSASKSTMLLLSTIGYVPWYCASLLGRSRWTFLRPLLFSVVASVVVAGGLHTLAACMVVDSLWVLLAVTLATALVYIPLALRLGFGRQDRQAVLRLVWGRTTRNKEPESP
jgi:membrane protein EpsK